MSKSLIEEFEKSLQTGFIDKSSISEVLYQPELLVNRKKPPKKVLTTIIQELNNCEEFYFSVAFVTTGGVATLINSLKLLEQRGIKGKILVSQYLNFTQPEALKRLSNFKNIELKISVNENSHSKGYIFKSFDYYNLIIGSSNLTATALSTNKEWNLKVSGIYSSSIVEKVLSEFESDFTNGIAVTKEFITNYSEIYNKQLLLNISNESNDLSLNGGEIIPNTMQEEALKNLAQLRANSKKKALLISATGTGKTFLSAFDAKEFSAKKLLFVVHRLNIAEKAMKSFQKIFKNEKTMGLYSGNLKQLDNDFIFSTVQTISKQTSLDQFKKDQFDYIIIDESHRSGADSYLRLINYFKPKFLLGMTATPERTDGNDIFSLFDHNIAYEIRLNRAMEEDMLSQFHYFGVTDLIVDDNIHENTSDFNLLTRDERVEKIITTAEFYGSDNGITRGLVFCSRNEEANELSNKFNEQGYKTIALSGANSENERVNAIDKLESDDLNNKLDYIFTVDIFNEGVDIPRINQILMIRPTESAIIFIQQLGRGLRKTEGKGYLTIVDFIGNYKNNYLIPIALYGDTSYNKDSLRKLLSEGSRMIPGASTINFDKITKERIFQSIDSANMQLLADLKNDYNLLKYKLGKSPMMMDFIEHGSRDAFLFVNYSSSYFNFVSKVDKDFNDLITAYQKNLLELFSIEICNAKRIEETIILKELIENTKLEIGDFKEIILKKYGYEVSMKTINSCVNNLNFSFVKKDKKILKFNSKFEIEDEFKANLKNQIFKSFLMDVIDYSISCYNKTYSLENFRNGFILYNKYTRKDVCRILNWEFNWDSTVYGYKIHNGSAPLFVTYKKSNDISITTNYNDHFINKQEFAWESKSNRTIKSNEIIKLSSSIENDLRICLFIQKSNDEGKDFYFMGDLQVIKNSIKQDFKVDKNKKIPVVHFNFKLNDSVQDSLYNYIIDNKIDAYTPRLNSDVKNSEIIINNKKVVVEQKLPENNIFRLQNSIPLYNFYAAAGAFSEMQPEKDFSYINLPDKYKFNKDYFACKIVGESMNRVIPNGSICLFKIYSGGSRNGKIVLVENFDYQDPDFNSAFTIKTYSSKKIVSEDNWVHSSIVLRPNSYDKNYKDIVIDEDNGATMKVVGEFVEVLD